MTDTHNAPTAGDAGSTGHAVITCGLDGTITGWNPAAERLYGYTRDEAVGRNFNVIVVPGLRDERDRYLRKALASADNVNYNTVRRAKGGTLVDVEVVISPVRGHDGILSGVTSTETPLADTKRSRKHDDQVVASVTAADVAVDVVDAMREAVVLLTLDGIVLSGNPALEALVGLKREAIIGRRLQDYLPDIVGANVPGGAMHPLERVQDEKVVELPPVAVSPEEGSVVYVAPTLALVAPRTDEPVAAILTLHDVTNVRRYQSNLRALTERLVKTEEQERIRLSRYVHDMIIQNLSLSRIRLGSVERPLAETGRHEEIETLQSIRDLIDETIGQCRSVMSELAPPLLYEVGLAAALEELAEKLESQSGTPVRITDEGIPVDIDHSLRSLLYQSARELIMNALKHAGNCKVDVRLASDEKSVHLVVQDDGRGYDPETVASRLDEGSSFGLFNIRERVDGLGGRLDIKTRPGDGTVARITVPLDAGRRQRRDS